MGIHRRYIVITQQAIESAALENANKRWGKYNTKSPSALFAAKESFIDGVNWALRQTQSEQLAKKQ